MPKAARPLRRLQNEMQMLLYTERVNDQRTARGLPPINSFWLSGTGALPAGRGDRPTQRRSSPTRLRDAALQDDGAAWAAAWQALDAGPVATLLAASERGGDVVLTLCGDSSARRFTLTRQRSAASIWLRVKRTFGRQRAATVLETL